MKVGTRRMRYPGGDPECGPACWHTWNGSRWVEDVDHGMDNMDPRRERRMLRRMYGSTLALYDAHTTGEWDVERGVDRPNPYPPGRRHDEYERGRARLVGEGC